MHPFIAKSFGGLSARYYFRQLFFGLLMGGLMAAALVRSPSANGSSLVFTMGYLVVCTVLYPYARFVYEGVTGFIMGQNVFYVPALLMLFVKALSMVLCFVGAPFIAPVGLCYLYLRHTRDERAAPSV